MDADRVGVDVIDQIFNAMGIDDDRSVRNSRAFQWWGHRLVQKVSAAPPDLIDSFAITRLACSTRLAVEVPESEFTYKALAALNALGTMSPLIYDPTNSSVTMALVSYLHEDNLWWTKVLKA